MVGFSTEGDLSIAGRHLLIDLYGCTQVASPDGIKTKLSQICTELGATVLFAHAHEFHNGGSSGVVILAESHATWHHWLDEGFIALDIFVCGECKPQDAITSLVEFFKPSDTKTNLQLRGHM
jgi:S-adenosylmethionine decarboxylase